MGIISITKEGSQLTLARGGRNNNGDFGENIKIETPKCHLLFMYMCIDIYANTFCQNKLRLIKFDFSLICTHIQINAVHTNATELFLIWDSYFFQ